MTNRADLVCIAMALLAASPALPARPMPDAGFLEFLGVMIESEGEWVDPLDMATVIPGEAASGGAARPGDGTEERDQPGNGGTVESDDEGNH